MRADDFVRTGTDAAQAAADMAANHTTDAVSSGIVGSADKSGLQLKEQLVGDRNSGLGNGWPPEGSNLAGFGSGNIDPNMTDYAGQAANVQVGAMHDDVSSAAVYGSKAEREASRLVNSGTAASRAASMLKQTGGKVAADRLVSSETGRQKLFSKANLKKAAKGAVLSEALSGSEFEDIDSYYYKAKGTYNLAKKGYTKAKSALEKRAAKKAAKAGKDVSGGASKAKKVAEKKTKEKTAKQAQKAAQSARNQRQAIAVAQEAKAAGAAKAGAVKSGAALKGVVGAAGTGIGPLIALIGIPILIGIGFIFSLMLVSTIFSNNESSNGVGSLTGVEAEVASALQGYGFTNESIAAVLGNFAQESGGYGNINPNNDSDDGYGTISLGMMQMTGYERTRYLAWCSQNGKEWGSASAQIEWCFSNEPGTEEGYFMKRWSSRWGHTHYYEDERGYEARFSTDCYSNGDDFKNSNDVDLATYSWMACYERPGSRKSYHDDVSRLNNRLDYAHRYLEALNTGGGESGQDYASSSEMQKKIVDQCKREPTTGSGQCAKWTNNVYEHATGQRPYANANDEYFKYCVSSDRSQLKVGMLIASGPHVGHTGRYRSGAGNSTAYGHIGIYIGDNKVMHSTGGSVHTDNLDDWINSFTVKDITCNQVMTAKWGFPPWV